MDARSLTDLPDRVKHSLNSVRLLRIVSLLMDFQEIIEEEDEDYVAKIVDHFFQLVFEHKECLADWLYELDIVLKGPHLETLVREDSALYAEMEAIETYYLSLANNMIENRKELFKTLSRPLREQFERDIRELTQALTIMLKAAFLMKYFYKYEGVRKGDRPQYLGPLISDLFAVMNNHAYARALTSFISELSLLLDNKELSTLFASYEEFDLDYLSIMRSPAPTSPFLH